MAKVKKVGNRYTALVVIMLLSFSVIIYRLIVLQVVNHSEYLDLANYKSTRQIPEFAPRGEISDKNGIKLATNMQSYSLIYMQTDESNKGFFQTFKEVFKRLDEVAKKDKDGKIIKVADNYEINVAPFSFDFKNTNPNLIRSLELRFKKDRGFNDKVRQRLYKDKQERELSEEEKTNIDLELLKITPEETFYDLIRLYGLYKLIGLDSVSEKLMLKEKTNKEITNMILEKYPIEELRRYMIVKDALWLQNFSGYKPIVISINIERETAFLFEQVKSNLPGIDVTTQPLRYYPYKELGASFIGYISKINNEKVETYEQKGYDVAADYIGVAGLERTFEDRLKGSKGAATVKINNQGRKMQDLFRLDSDPGQNIGLTIDKNLQQVAESALNDVILNLQKNYIHVGDTVNTANATRGAAVVLDVNTGAILAMASNPSYDPNIFTTPGALTPELAQSYFAPDLSAFGSAYIKRLGLSRYNTTVDKLFPVTGKAENAAEERKDQYDIYPKRFFNYATSSLIPPGSTFKPMTAIAGLEEGVITPYSRITDKGPFTTNSYKGACWLWNEYHYTHGSITVQTALEKSCNYFFFEVGDRLYNNGGLDNLARYAWKFGLGVDPKSKVKPSTGVEIYENFGQVYNHESRKSLGAYYAMFGLSDMLNGGSYRPGNGGNVFFAPIHISKNDLDDDKLKQAKIDLKDAISKCIINVSNKDNMATVYLNLKKDLIPLFTKLIEAYPEDKKAAFSIKDPTNMAEATSTFITFDTISQIITPGNVYDAVIGQGTNNFTPLQLANYMSTLVNGGKRYKLHLVDKFTDSKGAIVEQVKPEILESINLNQNNVNAVKVGMELVTDEGGTASTTFKDFPIKTAGKTGSATFGENQEEIGRTSYGIYLGFAPYDKPEIAVCVVVFDGGHGGYVSDVARGIYEAYFREHLKTNFPEFVPKFGYTLNP